MKRSVIFMALCLWSVLACAKAPTGMWTTYDDKTGKKRSQMKLSLDDNKILTGRVVRVYPQHGDTGICKACPGEFKDKPIQGLQILWGLTEHETGSWTGGEILDPKSGRIYSVKLIQKGDKLYVRGFLGVSLLGRTQVWKR